MKMNIFAVENIQLRYTMSVVSSTKINQLLRDTSPSGLIFSDWMRHHGYSPQLQKRYRDCGWLSSLSKGVMYRAGSKLRAYDAIASYNKQMDKNVCIAAVSALEYAGFNHFVPMGKPVLSITLENERLAPIWMKSDLFDMTFRPLTINILKNKSIIKKEVESGVLFISSPEQAFLECLACTPKYYTYMDLYYIMEQLTTLRSDVLQVLLENMTNFSVKRMFLYMAEKAGHYWFDELNLEAIDLGTSKLQLVGKGVYIAKYRITIPKELKDYEG